MFFKVSLKHGSGQKQIDQLVNRRVEAAVANGVRSQDIQFNGRKKASAKSGKYFYLHSAWKIAMNVYVKGMKLSNNFLKNYEFIMHLSSKVCCNFFLANHIISCDTITSF